MEETVAHLFRGDNAPVNTQLLSNSYISRLTAGNVPLDQNNNLSCTSFQPVRRQTLNQAGLVVTKIESIFESIVDCITEEKKELFIELKSRTRSNDSRDGIKIRFPSRDPKEAWRFAALCRILELSHEALVSGVVTTKRDIYYKDPELFMRQSVVDRYVDDIAYTFGVNRGALNVAAAAKGLIVGELTVTLRDGTKSDYWRRQEGSLIPKADNIENVDIGGSRWILVIEKEATFSALASGAYWQNSAAGKGILVTAKGYPDIQTRKFLNLLSTSFPSLPILALVDFDPDGIAIMATYQQGSVSLAHETDLVVPSLQWLGLRSSDFLKDESISQQLLPLSARDRNIAKKMLTRYSSDGADDEWLRELQTMLTLNRKAEIQIVGDGDNLGQWLDTRLARTCR